ncbi:hypothetical protein CEXT_474741 [Caerostris extrusa]|uniref:Uncharacterized protein n=1 Tax=Caerostris extrusa TaxID=172846 RepID=A0AAV4TBX9_CAEEX|nr:hypothetical protein CEXT_474741 [Caerostris extrusa]
MLQIPTGNRFNGTCTLILGSARWLFCAEEVSFFRERYFGSDFWRFVRHYGENEKETENRWEKGKRNLSLLQENGADWLFSRLIAR